MKKIIALALAFLMLLGLVACGNSGAGGNGGEDTTEAASGGFRVGYGKANITPDGQVGMGGYGRSDQRLSTGVLSYLWATCIAVTDADDNTVLIYGLDLSASGTAMDYIGDVAAATGVPMDNIFMSASHTHSSPDYGVQTSGSGAAVKKLRQGLIDAAVTAMEDRKPAEMFAGSVETEGMNFVRHYLCNDGTYCGDNFGSSASGYAGHASDADSQLQVVKFVREGDNEIWFTNFQTHPHQTGGSKKYDLSADVVGRYRETMENDLGVEVIYLSGAGGNINSHSRIKEEQATQDWKAWGDKLAEYAQSIEFKPINSGKVQVSKVTFSAKINHEWDDYAGVCRDLRSRWDKGEIETAQVIALGAEAGIKLNSPYHAGAIANRASMGDSSSFDIQALSFGDVGLASAPYEMFDTNGVFIKENSPFPVTFVATCSNGGNGYFPSQFAFDTYGGYECDTTKYVPGTAEELADTYVSMLTEQYNNR